MIEKCNEKFLELLGEKYPTVQAATSEIINLEAILRLPKGTEHFISDLHGEYEAFCHLMNSKSGAIREKVDMLYDKILPEKERARFATLIYYPHQIIEDVKAHESAAGLNEWYKTRRHIYFRHRYGRPKSPTSSANGYSDPIRPHCLSTNAT